MKGLNPVEVIKLTEITISNKVVTAIEIILNGWLRSLGSKKSKSSILLKTPIKDIITAIINIWLVGADEPMGPKSNANICFK